MDNMMLRAKEIAQHAHHGQLDKSGEPYFSHPEAVVNILLQSPAFNLLNKQEKHDAVCVAWLHDVVEDTLVTLKDLFYEGFTQGVVHNVSLMTFEHHGNREDYYNKILTSEIARSVKISDIAHNSSRDRLQKLPKETQIRLVEKYTKAVKILLKPEEQKWFNLVTDYSLKA